MNPLASRIMREAVFHKLLADEFRLAVTRSDVHNEPLDVSAIDFVKSFAYEPMMLADNVLRSVRLELERNTSEAESVAQRIGLQRSQFIHAIFGNLSHQIRTLRQTYP